MSVAESIKAKLTESFAPTRLDIIDESDQHAGHAGWQPGGETHFSVSIASPAFADLSRVERHRRVYEVLAEELRGPVHALRLTATCD